ncbi:Hypothetical predicted protein [Cloeon dipterum]|uniref:Uncharacterized protein n=1 Tax=Cloeon dipterum TaxID=197152 RepID=A0A8S1DKL7_9INSE|nr:Hypothetical predicted protein [Cloeon dipterum]
MATPTTRRKRLSSLFIANENEIKLGEVSIALRFCVLDKIIPDAVVLNMAAARVGNGEVSSTVKSGSDESPVDDDDEVLRISYKDVPDDFFDSLVTEECPEDTKQKQPHAAESATKEKDKADQTDLRIKLTDRKKVESGEQKKVDDKKKDGGGTRRSRSPEKRRAVSPRKVSPKRRRSNSPQRKSRSPRATKRRSPVCRPPPKNRRSVSPKREISPRRTFTKKSPSPRRNSATHRPSPRRSPARRRSASRSPRRPSTDLFSARMNSRRNRQRRSISPMRRDCRKSISLSPEPPERASRSQATRSIPRRRSRSRSRSPLRKISGTPPQNTFMTSTKPSLLSTPQPSLEEIASGAAIPYQMPYGGYRPPGQMMYNYPHPQAPYHPPVMQYPQRYPSQPAVPGIGDVGTLSMAYPLPQPVPRPFLEDPLPSPSTPPAPKTKKPLKTMSSITSGASSNDIDESKNSMKLSDFLASMTAANNKPMEYKKAIDDRIKAAIARFDATFLQPLRFQVIPSTVEVKDEVEALPNQSPLLKKPLVKLDNFIRPLNLRALKVPDKPQFVCKKPELVPPKPEISIKKLLASNKKQVSRKDSCTSPIRVRNSNVGCQTDPIPDPPPPICLTCIERNKRTYINHWTQMKPTAMCDTSVQTMDMPVPRLGPPVNPYEQEDLRHSLRGRVSPWEYENQRDDPHALMEPQHLPRSPINRPPELYESPPRYAPQTFLPMPEVIYRRRTRSPSPQLPPPHYHDYQLSPRMISPPARRILSPPRRLSPPAHPSCLRRAESRRGF